MRESLKICFALLFIIAGTLHFLKTETYLKIMPPYLPFAKALVLITGALAVVLGVLLTLRTTSRVAAWGIIIFLIAVFPANIHMAFHPEIFPQIPAWVDWARLPIQLLLILWAYCYAR